jgi:hypothetical protein
MNLAATSIEKKIGTPVTIQNRMECVDQAMADE